LPTPPDHAETPISRPAHYVRQIEIKPKWLTTAEVAVMLGYGLTKTKMLVVSGELRSLKDGGSRRIMPEWVDDYIARRVADAEGNAA
jgi:excisionase family DNA binding protein